MVMMLWISPCRPACWVIACMRNAQFGSLVARLDDEYQELWYVSARALKTCLNI